MRLGVVEDKTCLRMRPGFGQFATGERAPRADRQRQPAVDGLAQLGALHALVLAPDGGLRGQLLERSIVDRMVGAAERFVFEGAPILVDPLAQRAGASGGRQNDGPPARWFCSASVRRLSAAAS